MICKKRYWYFVIELGKTQGALNLAKAELLLEKEMVNKTVENLLKDLEQSKAENYDLLISNERLNEKYQNLMLKYEDIVEVVEILQIRRN